MVGMGVNMEMGKVVGMEVSVEVGLGVTIAATLPSGVDVGLMFALIVPKIKLHANMASRMIAPNIPAITIHLGGNRGLS